MLADDDVAAIAKFATRSACAAGVTLFRQGEQADRVFVIWSGEVELVYETATDRFILQLLGPGASVGDVPVLLDVANPYSARTRTPCDVLELSRDDAEAMLAEDPQLAVRWLRIVTRRLLRAYDRIIELGGRSAIEQVAQFVGHECERRQTDVLTITQADVASTLGLSRQTVSRALAVLEELGAIERRRASVAVCDPSRLHALLRR